MVLDTLEIILRLLIEIHRRLVYYYENSHCACGTIEDGYWGGGVYF